MLVAAGPTLRRRRRRGLSDVVGTVEDGDGMEQVTVTTWHPAAYLMMTRERSPLDIQRS